MNAPAYAVDGCTVRIQAPVEVSRAAGHLWFSSIHPFNGQEILCQATVADDKAQGNWPAILFLTRDGGATWSEAGRITYGPVSALCGLRTRLILPYEQWPLTPGDCRNTRAQGWQVTLTDIGTVQTDPVPVEVHGLPRDLAPYHEGELCLLTNGNLLPLRDGRLFATLYGTFAGETKYTNLAMTSGDLGRTWEYLSTVASWEEIPDGVEGPDESNSARLPDGRILCVYRVGSGNEQPYYASESADEGRTWSRPRALDGAWSVEPQLVCLENGVLLLSGGRTGLFLWVCPEGDGRRWHRLNLAEHHNAGVADQGMRFPEAFCAAQGESGLSTSYTGMAAIGPDEVLLSYDRLANGWHGAPGPWGQHDAVFTMRLRVHREQRAEA